MLKLHPFLALIGGSAVLGIVARYPLADTLDSFAAGFGSTVAGVGIEVRLAIEYDGLWHAGAGQFGRDRRRLNALHAAGWRVLHVTRLICTI